MFFFSPEKCCAPVDFCGQIFQRKYRLPRFVIRISMFLECTLDNNISVLPRPQRLPLNGRPKRSRAETKASEGKSRLASVLS